MEKIVILSLGKSGTTSTDLFFKNLGYRSLQWLGSKVDPETFKDMSMENMLISSNYLEEEYDVFSDYPYCMSYEYFDKKYKDTKFILITRDPKEWVVSVKNHDKIQKFTPIRTASWKKYLDIKNKTMDDFSNKQLENLYKSHTNDVIEYFKNSKNFIHLKLEDKDKAYKICKFLNISSCIEFPKVNVTKPCSPTEN
jgi:hypothetical protein